MVQLLLMEARSPLFRLGSRGFGPCLPAPYGGESERVSNNRSTASFSRFSGCPAVRLAALLVVSFASAPPSALDAQEARPHILLVNDDGIGSEGIATMAAELETFADVVVVAPAENRSGSSVSTVIRRIRAEVKPFLRDGEIFGYSVNATPADAAKFGILHFGAERPFDLVVSGINAGANTGDIAHYSGTVGAGMEALYHGLPAIATSQSAGQDYALTARPTSRCSKRWTGGSWRDGSWAPRWTEGSETARHP